LYARLADLPAREVIVVLDACFSGGGGRSVLAPRTRPVGLALEEPLPVSSKIVALAASTGAQVSSSLGSHKHRLLTYFFLRGLRGKADQDLDGAINLDELYRSLSPQVEHIARKELHLKQTPRLLGDPTVAKAVWLLKGVPR
jgi:uncharacterized caspase-like protein